MPNWRALVIADNLFPVVIKVRPYWKRTRSRLGLAPRPPVLTAWADTVGGNGHAPVRDIAALPWPAGVGADDGAEA
jgi:hypothetical protein